MQINYKQLDFFCVLFVQLDICHLLDHISHTLPTKLAQLAQVSAINVNICNFCSLVSNCPVTRLEVFITNLKLTNAAH